MPIGGVLNHCGAARKRVKTPPHPPTHRHTCCRKYIANGLSHVRYRSVHSHMQSGPYESEHISLIPDPVLLEPKSDCHSIAKYAGAHTETVPYQQAVLGREGQAQEDVHVAANGVQCAEVKSTSNRVWLRLVGKRHDVQVWQPDKRPIANPFTRKYVRVCTAWRHRLHGMAPPSARHDATVCTARCHRRTGKAHRMVVWCGIREVGRRVPRAAWPRVGSLGYLFSRFRLGSVCLLATPFLRPSPQMLLCCSTAPLAYAHTYTNTWGVFAVPSLAAGTPSSGGKASSGSQSRWRSGASASSTTSSCACPPRTARRRRRWSFTRW
jgi:hypothetical protein